jgi:hypothetical protein
MMNTSQVSPTSPVDTGAEINERHTRKCSICRHPDRDAIEDEFLHWHRVIWIAQEFHIADHRSIYRHARAVGLIQARRENLHSALDNIVEQSDGIRASASDVLKAMRAYSCLDAATGRWTEPPKQVLVTNIVQRGTDNPVCAPATEDSAAEEPIGGPMPPSAELDASIFNDDTTDPSSPNYIAQGPPPPDYVDPARAGAPLIGPPVIRIPSNSHKTKARHHG